MLTPEQVKNGPRTPQAYAETIHTLADALREAVGALEDIAIGKYNNFNGQREFAAEVLSSIESKVSREWLSGQDGLMHDVDA
ncbi:hypothetical protein [Alicyclobacillus macrosporangiidus]|uniref:Uncharacterized protein n=1 Tax=Alicyclobacillus macrosporangiidus TaxID=392015 RepID=A0A1I7KBK8_9BACL|nr:hypothetical protein [Alicyclobacillus macrosporangiidus]SFU94760.1 hypothetical protein SAMN05421543_1152 [Alicyclobacillus macrosporangiidus]